MSSINDATDVLRDTSDDEAVTTVLSDLFESIESADDIPTWDDGPDASAFIAKPEQELDDLMPEGPFTIRLMGTVYDEVYEDLMLQLLRRGLLAGADVWHAPQWIPFSEHPDFGALQALMAAEVERLVARNKPPRELTPQPHWRTPQNTRSSKEVTRPSVRLSDIEGMEFESEGLDEQTGEGLAHHSESLDDSRKTAEFDPEPFRRFANQYGDETEVTGGESIDAALASIPAKNRTDSKGPGGPPDFEEPSDTEVSEILTLEESDEDEIETREANSLAAVRVAAAGQESDVRVRQHSPLEGTGAPKTSFPVEAGASAIRGDRQQEPHTGEPVPGAAIVRPPNREPQTDDRLQQPARKKQPTAALPRVSRGSGQRAEPNDAGRDLGRSSRVPTWLVYVAVIAIVISILAIAVVSVRYWSAYADASPATGPTATESAIGAANSELHESLPQAFTDARGFASVAESLADETPQKKVWVLTSLHASAPTAESALAAASASLEAGDYDQARRLAAEAVTLGGEVAEIRPLFADALRATPELERESTQRWDAIDGLERDGERLVARVEGEYWVVVPATDSDPDGFRTALSYARLCAIFSCRFAVPQTYRVTIDRDALLAASTASEAVETDSLRWTSTPDGDVVNAAAFPISAEAKPFPIVDDKQWRGWLAVGPLDPEERAELLSLSSGIAPVELVGQLSNMLTLDYLTNNWSRIPESDVSTTAIDGGKLVSTWHGAAFATRSSRRVEDRFRWVERFDRRLVAELRLVTPGMIDHLLFVDGDPISEARRDEFWSQREELLEAVDDAEKEHGDAIWL